MIGAMNLEISSCHCVENCAGVRPKKAVRIEMTAKDRNG
jgi:hypothetical protein